MITRIFTTVAFLMIFSCAWAQVRQRSKFTVNQTPAGIALYEGGKPVLFYQVQPKSSTDGILYNNYIHPLYGLNGEILTEEFPIDHPYHRGIYWAWHQIYAGEASIGDSWVMKDVRFEVKTAKAEIRKGTARILLEADWISSGFRNGETFLIEQTSITVLPVKNGKRIIDVSIELKPLFAGLSIGGSEDVEKGYGGFCARLVTPADLTFTSVNGPVIPTNAQVSAGHWMDFTGTFSMAESSGITIFSHPSNPGSSTGWILRQKESMQNAVFPGSQRFSLSMKKVTRLHYRMLIHQGKAEIHDLLQEQVTYEKMSYSKY